MEIANTVARIWAKSRLEPGSLKPAGWLPLVRHLDDSAAVVVVLPTRAGTRELERGQVDYRCLMRDDPVTVAGGGVGRSLCVVGLPEEFDDRVQGPESS